MLDEATVNARNKIEWIKSYFNIALAIVLIVFIALGVIFAAICKGQWVYLVMWLLLLFQTLGYTSIKPLISLIQIKPTEGQRQAQERVFKSNDVKIKIRWINNKLGRIDADIEIDMFNASKGYHHRWLMYEDMHVKYGFMHESFNLIIGVLSYVTYIAMLIISLFCDSVIWAIVLFGFIITRQIILAIISNDPKYIINQSTVNTLRHVQKDSIPGSQLYF